MTAVSFPLRAASVSFPYHVLLFVLTGASLGGTLCAAGGWFLLHPLGLGGILLLVGGIWLYLGGKAALLAGCLCGTFALTNGQMWHVLHPQFPAHHLRQLALPQKVSLEGWLFREPEHAPHRGRLYVQTLRLWENGVPRSATGKVLVTVRTLSDAWHYGDVVHFTFTLRQPRNFQTPGSFDYEGYLARQDIFLTAFLWDDTTMKYVGANGNKLWRKIEQIRLTIGEFFATHLEAETAAVLQALIIGDERAITADLRQAFSRAGVAHVLSISGLHMSLVATVAYGLWWWVVGRSRFLLLRFSAPTMAALLTIPPVLLYASISGGSVATWRSVLMALTYLLALFVGRPSEAYRSLAFAALLISILWPGALFDVSFQLSFVAVLSLFFATERFLAWWKKRQRPSLDKGSWREQFLRWGGTYLAISGGTLLGTLPITAASFNQVTLVGLFANVFVVPLLGSAAVILGLLAAGCVFLHAGLAALVVVCAGVVVSLGIWVTHWCAAFPYAALHIVTPTLFELLLFYGLLFCALFRSLLRQFSPSLRFLPYCLLLLLFLDIAGWFWQRYYHGELRLTFLDVGQGDAAVVELPNAQVMVIDGGGFASEEFDSGKALLAPFLWSRKIGHVDILVLSHPQLDHYGGLTYLVEHFSPRELWFNGNSTESKRFHHLQEALIRHGVSSRVLCRDMPPFMLNEVKIQILHPPCQQDGLGTNDASLVFRLSYGSIDVLFTGDIERAGESVLLTAQQDLASEIVKVPHHGSRTSSSAAFIQAVTPQVAVASLGFQNRFRFPAPEIVQRYTQNGSLFLRTDEQGTITIGSDGDSYTVDSFLSPLSALFPAEKEKRAGNPAGTYGDHGRKSLGQ